MISVLRGTDKGERPYFDTDGEALVVAISEDTTLYCSSEEEFEELIREPEPYDTFH